MTEGQEAVDAFTHAYAAVREKHRALPTLDAVDKEWDILEMLCRDRHTPRNALMYVRWHMMRAINGWASYLHEFILPNPHNAVSLEEYDYFDDKEKEDIVAVLYWIMYRNRCANALQLDEDDAKTATFVIEVWKEWHERKQLLRSIIAKNMNVWREKVTPPKK
jgi:urease accessory protein UreF